MQVFREADTGIVNIINTSNTAFYKTPTDTPQSMFILDQSFVEVTTNIVSDVPVVVSLIDGLTNAEYANVTIPPGTASGDKFMLKPVGGTTTLQFEDGKSYKRDPGLNFNIQPSGGNSFQTPAQTNQNPKVLGLRAKTAAGGAGAAGAVRGRLIVGYMPALNYGGNQNVYGTTQPVYID